MPGPSLFVAVLPSNIPLAGPVTLPPPASGLQFWCEVLLLLIWLFFINQPLPPPANPSSPLLLSWLLTIRLLFPNFTPTDALNWIMQFVTVQPLPDPQSTAAFCKAEL